MKEKIIKFLDRKHQDFVEVLLQATLFNVGDGLTMSQIVDITSYTEQTIRKIINHINKEWSIIKIDKTNKPYKYTIDVDRVSQIKNSFE
ncbi:MAG: hypothetical protein K2P09_00500 [Erysipelotrichales bacterium]|nr:hypothetical protein [Erysipelotrichales bacterium]